MRGESGDCSFVDLGLLIVLLVASLAAGTTLPRMESYIVVAFAYFVVLSICYLRGTLGLRASSAVLTPLRVLWAVFIIVFLLTPTPRAALRLGAFMVFSVITLIVIPGTFSRETFVDALALVAAGVAALAVPLSQGSLLDGQLGSGIWNVLHLVIGTDFAIPVLTSIFVNPNYLAMLSAFGIIAAVGFGRTTTRRPIAFLFIALCTFSLLVSRGRAASLGLVGGVVLYIAYYLRGTKAVVPLISLGVVGGVVVFSVVIGASSGLPFTASMFSHRSEIWSAALRAIEARPLLGWGLIDTQRVIFEHGGPLIRGNMPGTHNSYLRMFLLTGIVGGIAYLALCSAIVYRAVIATRDKSVISGVLLSLLALALAAQLFGGSTLFGLSIGSIYASLIAGYSQNGHRVRWESSDLLQRVSSKQSQRVTDSSD